MVFYKTWKKYNEIQLTKKNVDLNNLKMKNKPLFPDLLMKVQHTSLRREFVARDN